MKSIFLLSCILFSFVLCAETPEESAVKFVTTWYNGDFATIKANCNPRHSLLKPGYEPKEDLAGLAAVQKEPGSGFRFRRSLAGWPLYGVASSPV